MLRYLPTNLSMRQIAGELYVSHNTVRTHISHLYAKLGTHTRARPSPAPGPSACWPPPRCEATPRVLADGRGRQVWPAGFRASRRVR